MEKVLWRLAWVITGVFFFHDVQLKEELSGWQLPLFFTVKVKEICLHAFEQLWPDLQFYRRNIYQKKKISPFLFSINIKSTGCHYGKLLTSNSMTIWHRVPNGTEAFLHVPLTFSFQITWVLRNLKESINFHGSRQDQGKIKSPPMKWVISHKYSLYLLVFTENEESLTKPAKFFFFPLSVPYEANLPRKISASSADDYWSFHKSIPPLEGDVIPLALLLGSKQLHAGAAGWVCLWN